MSETAHGEGHETSGGNESTHASNHWLERAFTKTKRWLGHGLLTIGGEAFVRMGSVTLPLGIICSWATANPLPAMLGALPTAIGAKIEWESGVKKTGEGEKVIWGLSKAAETASSYLAPGMAVATGVVSAATALYATRKRGDGAHH